MPTANPLGGDACTALGDPGRWFVGVASCGPLMQDGLIALCAQSAAASPSPLQACNGWTRTLLGSLRNCWGDRLQLVNGIAALQAERRWGALQGLDHY
jgi:glucokinase